uniref:Uncharacterized protein n=1 Tax=Trichogramma kaykai TaxID=54128 RepID=A0ABD2XSG3_9HYME
MSQKYCLESSKKWQQEVDWPITYDESEFFRPLAILIENWEGQLPNLRDIFVRKEIEDILIYSWRFKERRDIIRFVAETGYVDVPDFDKDGASLCHIASLCCIA